jgi:antitoxin HigA-1
LHLSQTALARAIDVPPGRINEIVLASAPSLPTPSCGWHAVSTRCFKMSDGFFLGLQTDCELMQRRRQIGDRVKAIKPRAA